MAVLRVSNADRVVFPEVSRTKGDVVTYYERIAPRALPHLVDRPLSIRRYPKGLAAPGFFQKNVPPHYPASIERFEVPRSKAAAKAHPKGKDQDVTIYPLVRAPEHLPYLANQGAIEMHVTTARAPDMSRADRVVVDLDPPPGALDLVRRAARLTREAMATFGLETVPVATGSKGYHVVAPVAPFDAETLSMTMYKLATLLASRHDGELTIAFRIAQRGGRVFVDWLRNRTSATMIAPYSLRATPRATVATPLSWAELDGHTPDAFSIADVDRLLDRDDPLAALAARPPDAGPFVSAVDEAFAEAGLTLEPFDRFR